MPALNVTEALTTVRPRPTRPAVVLAAPTLDAVKHRALALVDALAVLAFAAVGRRSHDESGALVGVLTTAAPFLLGALVGALATRSWRDPLSWRSGVGVWLGAVVVGLALRAVLYARLPASFAVVAAVALAVLVVGWRGAVRAVTTVRGRRARQDA